MYTHSIIMLLSWPVIILVSWFVIRFVITLYEKKQAKKQEQAGTDQLITIRAFLQTSYPPSRGGYKAVLWRPEPEAIK